MQQGIDHRASAALGKRVGAGFFQSVVWGLGVVGMTASASAGDSPARYADVLAYFEPGLNVDAVFGSDPAELYDNPLAALGGPGEEVTLSQGTPTETVSLGTWTDDPGTGTNDRPVGLTLGFSTPVRNGPGEDLNVVGNAPAAFTFYEPGFIEVARESDGGGATTDGWMDETFYLLKPSNYDAITAPGSAPNAITVTTDPVTFELTYSEPFEDDTTLVNYFDVTPGGDRVDLDSAIDAEGQSVELPDISYIRFRAVSDSAFPFDPVSYLSPEVDYVEVLSDTAVLGEGDYNLSGVVEQGDLDLVLLNWGRDTDVDGIPEGWINDDPVGLIDQAELDRVLLNWGGSVAANAPLGAVPEPAALVSAFVLIAGGYRRRR